MPFARSIKVLSRQGLVGLLGCLAVFASLSLQSPAHAKLNIVTTTGMIADTMREVAGERADVTALMGVGVDPHAYRQTRSDIARMVNADLVVWHGLYLEAQLEDFMADLAKQKRKIFQVVRDTGMSTHRKPHLFDTVAKHLLARFVQRAVLSYLAAGHQRVVANRTASKPLALLLASANNIVAHPTAGRPGGGRRR